MSSSCTPTSWTERMIRRLAGTLVTVSVLLAWQVHPGWIGLAGFVGLNLLQSSFTGFCPVENVLGRFDPARSRSDAGVRA